MSLGWWLLIVVIGAFVWMRLGQVSRADAHRLVQEGALLLDVRSPAEFAAGHLPGALNVPVQNLSGQLDRLSTNQPIVVYCASGARSGQARRFLRRKGYTVYDLGSARRW